MSTIEKFEDLKAWQSARELTKVVYGITARPDFSRDFGLRDQIRRAAVSVLSNIAEGFERDGNKEFLQFLHIAKGSCGEVRAQLYVALDQTYIDDEQFQQAHAKATEISRMIAGLIKYLNQTEIKGMKYKDNNKPKT
jgi:four helix bundle protein